MVERRNEKYKSRNDKLKKEEKKEKRNGIIKTIVKIFLIVGIIVLAFYMYMHYVGTKGINVREYKITDKGLPEEMHGLKVVHFSDLNYQSTVKEKELKNLVSKINKIKPDIVVFTGNLINKNAKLTKKEKETLVSYLNKIDARIGKYAIKGNNDYTNQYNIVIDLTDFKLIKNSYELIYYKGNTPIMLVGSGSSIKKDSDLGSAFSYNEMDNIYTIALIHEPDIAKSIVKNYNSNLILAGHSLNGQIRLPFIGGLIRFEGAKKYIEPKYNLGKTELYISGGIGTTGQEIRYFNHPSINFYRLTKGTK